MPILWRLLLSWYLKLFALASASLLCLLMATRLHNIARFATLGMSWSDLGLYSLCQIPYILPITCAFAAFLASLLIGRFVLRGQELIGLAACRLPLKELILPVGWISLFLCFANFYFVSELATSCHLKANRIIFSLQKTSPLALLKQPQLIDRGQFAAFSASSNGHLCEDFIFVFFQEKQKRLSLLRADEIGMDESSIVAKNSLLLAAKASHGGFDDLWIENIGKTRASGDLFSWLGSSQTRIHPDHLSLDLALSSYKESNGKKRNRLLTELGRRTAFSIAPFCLSLFGLAFALNRQPHRKTVPFWPTLLALLSLALIFVSKAFQTTPLLSWSVQLLPQCALLGTALFLFRLKEQGRRA